MKNIAPLLLILVVVLISFITNITNKNEVPNYTVNLEEEHREKKLILDDCDDEFCERNTDISGGISSMYVEGLELMLEYLPPDAMIDYEDYMNVYSDGLKSLLNGKKDFYNANKKNIGNIFGIYSYEDYFKFTKLFSGINENDRVQYIYINSIEEEKGVLNVQIEMHFSISNKVINVNQIVDYIYVKNKPMLFIYTRI